MKPTAELSKTKRTLNSLVFHSVENGAVVAVFALFNLAFFVSHPHDTIHLCLYVLSYPSCISRLTNVRLYLPSQYIVGRL